MTLNALVYGWYAPNWHPPQEGYPHPASAMVLCGPGPLWFAAIEVPRVHLERVQTTLFGVIAKSSDRFVVFGPVMCVHS